MRICSVSRFSTDITQAVVNSQGNWSKRSGVILGIEETNVPPTLDHPEHTRNGFGEASPLPGYSTDSLEDCERCLRDLQLFRAKDLSVSTIETFISAMPPLPAARFAVETALLDLLAQRQDRGIAGLFGQYASSSLRCALLQADAPVTSALSLESRGFRFAKLKIGKDWDAEFAMIKRLRTEAPGLSLRLDVNGAWTVPKAREHLDSLRPLAIEFVEQPVVPASMGQLATSPVAIAADESLRSLQDRHALTPLIQSGVLKVLVLKPTVLGGFMACLRLQRWGHKNNTHCLASHCFEGPVGSAAVAELALALDSPLAAGVDEHAVLASLAHNPIPQFRDRLIRPNARGLGVVPSQ